MRGIGQLARESGLTISALRFYDSAGVLLPARVDPHSNYRWYSDDQVLTARLVARLRRVGMPLADIARVVEHRQDRAVVDAILQAHLMRLEDGLADARRELSAAVSLLDMARLEQESPMTSTRVSTTAGELRKALGAVRYAVGTDPAIPMLTGVYLDVDEASVRFVATDRHRLSVATVPGAEVVGPPVGVVVPLDLLDGALAVDTASDSPVVVGLDGDQVTLDLAGSSVRGQRLTGDFPPYRRVLRSAAAHRVTADAATLRGELVGAPARSIRADDGSTETVTVLTLRADGALTFGGAADAQVEIGLNGEFLLQALDAGGSGQLLLELDGPIEPLALRKPERPDDVHMLMPIRLN